jgi:hypothetical protein
MTIYNDKEDALHAIDLAHNAKIHPDAIQYKEDSNG